MKLRKLEIKDAPFMLEWMKDPDVTGKLKNDFGSKTMEDCERFIMESWNQEENLHLGITDGNDRYMGTVSLKGIDLLRSCAEFAIAVRRGAMGKGYAGYGMAEILQIGWEERNLGMIYWNVRKDNVRAVRFYEKRGYKRINTAPECGGGWKSPQRISSGTWQSIPDSGKERLSGKRAFVHRKKLPVHVRSGNPASDREELR